MTELPPRRPAPGPLQPGDLVRAAYDALWNGRGELLRVAAVPVVLTLMIDAVLFFGVLMDEAATSPQPGPWFYALVLLSIPPSVLLAVNWLRVLVLGGAAVARLGLRWGRRETRFLLRLLVIGLAGLVGTLVLTLPVALVIGVLGQMFAPFRHLAAWLPFITFGLVLFVYAYLTLGFCMALVSAAIDGPGGLRDSWLATRGLRGQLVLAAIPVVGPFYLLLFLLPALFSALQLDQVAPLSSLLVQVLAATLTSAAGLALVAAIYRRLAGTPAPMSGVAP